MINFTPEATTLINHTFGSSCKPAPPPPLLPPPSSAIPLEMVHHNCRQCSTASSATTLVSVRNPWVFRMALMPLTEPCTLAQRITCCLSAWRQVALHHISPGSASDISGRTLNHSRAVWEKQPLLWEHCCCAWNS
jgi:hypothetical protein